MRVLLVEDDQPTGSALADALSAQHYTVNLVTDGQTGLDLATHYQYDLVLLDIIIPELDGISLCKRLRAEGYQAPILLLTAKDSSSDRVMGLDAGADDYVVKPFDLPELLARIRALLRRGKSVAVPPAIAWESIQFDSANNTVLCNGQPVHLTPKEYCLLELFLLNPRRIFSRSAILDRLWDFAESPGEETVSTHIKCVRQKLKAAGASNPIETVHGLGYRLRTPQMSPQLAQAPVQQSIQHPIQQSAIDTTSSANLQLEPLQQSLQQRIRAKTLRTWAKYQIALSAQIAVLEQAAKAVAERTLTDALHQQAKREAHKLAGSLGIFGLKVGSELARELEALLQTTEGIDALQNQFTERVQQLRQIFDQAELGFTHSHPIAPPLPSLSASSPSSLILMVDDDLILADQIRLAGAAQDIQIEVATDLTMARYMIGQLAPDLIVLDLSFPNPTDDGLSLLQELATRVPRIPTIVFTKRESLADRITAARLGSYAFLHKPSPADQILNLITTALSPKQQFSSENRVMVVDDDQALLTLLSGLLTAAGIVVATIAYPQQFWSVLTDFQPHLLVVDLKMPELNGVELCQVVRHDPAWDRLAILLLSAHSTVETIDQAFAAGANDFINKTVGPSEIVNRIVRRLAWGQRGSTINLKSG